MSYTLASDSFPRTVYEEYTFFTNTVAVYYTVNLKKINIFAFNITTYKKV